MHRPLRVVQIDHELVAVRHAPVPVHMAVRFLSFRAVMRVLVMRIVHVQMLVHHVFVAVQQRPIVLSRPEPGTGEHRCPRKHCQRSERHVEGQRRREPSGKRIGQQPAGVRQRELRRLGVRR